MSDPVAIAKEADALLSHAGVRVRDDLALVHVRGDDRLTWLNGQITADARKATSDAPVYALAVNVRGKIMADVWVLARGADLAVLLPKSALDAVLESFEHQIIMDDVTLVRDEDRAVVSVQGPVTVQVVEAAALDDAEAHACDELGVGGMFVLVASAALPEARTRLVAAAEARGGGAVSLDGVTLAHLRRGRPRFGVDFGLEHYPQEAGLERRAVAFDKGCYLGQEVICTLENRGRLSRQLATLSGRDRPPAPGAALSTAEGVQVGHITSAAPEPDGTVRALGYVKRTQLSPGTELLVDGSRLSVVGAVD